MRWTPTDTSHSSHAIGRQGRADESIDESTRALELTRNETERESLAAQVRGRLALEE
jgi:hypothetical protein